MAIWPAQIGQRVRTGPESRPITFIPALMIGDGIAALAVADRDQRQDEVAQARLHGLAVAAAHGGVELGRELRDEVEHRRGIGGDAHFEIGQREGLGRGQAADIGQAVAHAQMDARHQLDIADAVLVTHEVRIALAELRQRLFADDGVVAVVDDDAQLRRLADRVDMGGEPVLLGEDEIGRQQQDAVGARLLDAGREFRRDLRAIADAGEHRHAAPWSRQPPSPPPSRPRQVRARRTRRCRPAANRPATS
jgi:hypothetical protein